VARNTVVSCVGPAPLRVDPATGIDAAADAVRRHLEKHIMQVLPEGPDLIVLPEACDRADSFSIARRQEYYRALGTTNLDWMRGIARDNHCYIAFSTIREMADGTWRNTTFLIDREGAVAGAYDKNHPVIEEITEAGILSGAQAPIIPCDFGAVACAICFDLQFDRLRLHYRELHPDLLVFCSRYHGGLAQSLWAFGCRSWFAGAVAGLPCTILSPLGETVAASTMNVPHISARINLDCALVHLDNNLQRFAAAKQKYGRMLEMSEPPQGYLDVALISSQSEERTIRQIMEEFELEPLDEYLARSLAHQTDPANREDRGRSP
jgi:predicted amidohydrolase